MLGESWHKSRKHLGKVFSDIFCPCFWLEVGRNLLARKKEATCKSFIFPFSFFFSRQNKTRRKRKRDEAGNEFRNCFWGREATVCVCVCVCGIWGTQKNSEQTLVFFYFNLFAEYFLWCCYKSTSEFSADIKFFRRREKGCFFLCQNSSKTLLLLLNHTTTRLLNHFGGISERNGGEGKDSRHFFYFWT